MIFCRRILWAGFLCLVLPFAVKAEGIPKSLTASATAIQHANGVTNEPHSWWDTWPVALRLLGGSGISLNSFVAGNTTIYPGSGWNYGVELIPYYNPHLEIALSDFPISVSYQYPYPLDNITATDSFGTNATLFEIYVKQPYDQFSIFAGFGAGFAWGNTATETYSSGLPPVAVSLSTAPAFRSAFGLEDAPNATVTFSLMVSMLVADLFYQQQSAKQITTSDLNLLSLQLATTFRL